MNTNKDTIAAISTPKGIGAISIVRINGNNSYSIINDIFKPAFIKNISHGHAVFGSIVDSSYSKLLDQVVVTFFKSPNSFTGEDLIEISCHGGPYIVQTLLQIILEKGARLAEPGEFSTRAFLNGKLDLVQAESIIDVIHAQTQKALDASLAQLTGQLSKNFTEIQLSLKEKLALLELELDFSEEDIEFAKRDQLLTEIDLINNKIEKLINSFNYGKILREGAHIVITGIPNVGKSSILNRLLDQDRALVSDIPGTTRDSIEESLNIDGYLFKITDTAGLRSSTDLIEQEGVKRTRLLLKQADILLHTLDSTENINTSLTEINSNDSKSHLVLFNKIDTRSELDKDKIRKRFSPVPVIFISAKTGEGFDILENTLVNIILEKHDQHTSQVLTKVRHRDALVKAKDNLQQALSSLQQHLSPEFIALDLRAALDNIGEITGHVTTDDILNDIFDKFCIGK